MVKWARLPWGRIVKTTVRSAYQHDCTDAAAAMAFDFAFAIFPCLLVLTAMLVITGIPPDAFGQLLEDLGIVFPPPLLGIIDENILHLWDSYQSLFFIGMLGVIWPASASMSTTMSALNRAYGVRESRPFLHRRGLSLLLVVSMGLALVLLFNLIVFSEQIEAWLHARWSLFHNVPPLISLLRTTVGIPGTIGVAACIYRIAPDIRQRWSDVLPGSLLFCLLWSLIAGGFKYFVRSFSYYNVVVGVLGGVIILLLCAYLVAFTLLLGGELNGVLFRVRREGRGIRPEEEHHSRGDWQSLEVNQRSFIT